MFFGSLAHADVADGRRHEGAFRAFQRAQHDLDGKVRAVFPPRDELDSRSNLLRQSFRRTSRPIRDQPFRKALRNDVLHFLPNQFIAAVAKLLLCLHIQQDDFSALVHHHHGIRRRFQKSAVFRIRLRTLADIAADDGKPAQMSRRVARRRVGGSHEKSRAVFSQARSLIFIRAACSSHPKDIGWPAPCDVFRGKETGIILVGDLFEFVTCHSFGAGIPTANLALRAKHQYRVVLHPMDQPPVLFFAFLERPLRKSARGIIALSAPTSDTSDQQTQDCSEDQNCFSLREAALRVRLADYQQPQLFLLHLANELLKIIHDPFAGSCLDSVRGGLQTDGPSQANDSLCKLELLSGKRC